MSRLYLSRTTGCFTTSVSGVVAPISIPPLTERIPRSSLICPRSTTTFGLFSRSFSQSMLSSPPARTNASAPYRSSSLNASSIVAGWKSSNAGMTSLITAIKGLSNVRGQCFVGSFAAILQRIQDDVRRHRRPAEDLVAEGIGDRVHDRAVGRADRRLTDAARPHRGFRIGQVDGVSNELVRHVQNRRRLVLIEPARERHAVVLVVRPALGFRVADPQHRSAEELPFQAPRIHDNADVADRGVLEDLEMTRLGIDFHLGEANDIRLRRGPISRIGVLRRSDEALAGQRFDRVLGEGVDVVCCLVAVVLPAELDGLLRSLREGHAPARPGHLASRDSVRLGTPAVRLRSDLPQLVDAVGGHGMRRARHGMRRLAARRNAGPGEILRRVAEDDVTLLPRYIQHVGNHAVDVEQRVGAEIADARLNLNPAVGLDDEQTVEADRPAGKRTDGDTEATRLVPLLVAAVERRLLRIPLEGFAPFVERLLDERAGDIRLLPGRQRGTEGRLA